MNQKIKLLIPKAMKVIEDYELGLSGKKIDKEIKGYISSLGASILMSGLIPTLAVYSAKENNSQASRFIVLDWINKIIRENNIIDSQENALDLFKYALTLNNNTNTLTQNILDASIALKLSIRTFKLTD